MDIKLNDEQFAQVIGKQILESITPEARDKLVTDAIVALNKTETNYGRTAPSALQRAFNNAVGIAVELVEKSPVRDRILDAANAFIEVFPEHYGDDALQRDVMAAVVAHARRVREGADRG